MLGEKIGETSGKVTMQRVLPNLGGYQRWKHLFSQVDQCWAQT